MQSMRALQKTSYGRNRIAVGQVYEVDDKFVKVLEIGRIAERVESPQPVPDPEEPAEEEPTEQPEEPPRAKRKYTRRDLRAES